MGSLVFSSSMIASMMNFSLLSLSVSRWCISPTDVEAHDKLKIEMGRTYGFCNSHRCCFVVVVEGCEMSFVRGWQFSAWR